jgi:hypothetical protein
MTAVLAGARLRRRSRSDSERGFALLFIFVLMAGIAIGMLMELPRVAFETQREREEMLIERGEQYQRAIGLYVKTIKRYPAKIEDLESTNNMRFLRRRYIDPMTGKDEWRLIHVGPNGQLLDSLVKKPTQTTATKDGKAADSQSAENSMNADPSNTVGANNAPPEVNQAVRARPSDQVGLAGVMNQQNPYGYPQPPPAYAPAAQPNGQPQPYAPASGPQPYSPTPPMTGMQPGQQYLPGQPPAPGQPVPQYLPVQPLPPGYNPYGAQPGQLQAAIAPGQPVYPRVFQPGAQQATPDAPGQPVYVQPAQSGMPQSEAQQIYNPMQNIPGVIAPPQGQVAQPGLPQYRQPPQTVQQYPQPTQTGSVNLPPGSTVQGQMTAQQMIQSILTSPRQPPPSAFNNQGFGGGIAGVATTYKSPSIKIYNERQKYQEWEFIYDPKKDPALNPTIATGGAPSGATSSPTGSTPGLSNASGSSFSSSFGSSFSNSGPSGSPQPSPAPGAR